MKKNSKLKCYCEKCQNDTWHLVLFRKEIDLSDETYNYWGTEGWDIVQCAGCDDISFLHTHEDSESIVQTGDNEFDYYTRQTEYPSVLKFHKKIDFKGIFIPARITRLYDEIIQSIAAGSLQLSAVGLRMLVETICDDKYITGKNLEYKINKLCSEGYLSKQDARRLHGIRFIGNDAAHIDRIANDDEISVCLEIIENVINSIYILDRKSEMSIKLPLKDCNEAILLLREKYSSLEKGKLYTVNQLFAKDSRRISEEIMEKTLNEIVESIDNGSIDFLEKHIKNEKGNTKYAFKVV